MVPGGALISLSTGRRRTKTHLHSRRVYICIYISLDAGISFLHYEEVEEVKEVKEVAQEEAGEDDAWGRKRMTNLRAQGVIMKSFDCGIAERRRAGPIQFLNNRILNYF